MLTDQILPPSIEIGAVSLPHNNGAISWKKYLYTSSNLARLSLQMASSYTFSFEMIALVYTFECINNDQNNLASISLISSMLNTIVYIGVTPLFSISIITAKELGAYRLAEKNNSEEPQLNTNESREKIAVIYRHALLLASFLTIPMSFCLIFSQSLLDGLKQNAEVASITQDFLRPFALYIPSFMLRMCSEQIIYGFGQSKIVMQLALLSFIPTVTLGIALSLGSPGLPNLGQMGLLIGCISESYISAIVTFLYIARSKQFQSFNFLNFYRSWDKYADQRQQIATLGGFIVLVSLSETIGMLINSTLAGIIGVEQQAALSLCSQFTLITFLLQIACGQTCSQEMNRALGQNKFETVSLLGKSGLISSVTLVAPIPMLFAIYPGLLTGILGNGNAEIQKILNTLAPIMAVATLIDLIRYNLLQQLLILKDVQNAALISTVSLIFGVVLSAVLGLETDMNIYGVATGYAIGVSLAAISLLIRWVPRINQESIQKLCDLQNNSDPTESQTSSCCFMLFKKTSASKTKQSLIIEDDVMNPVYNGPFQEI